MFNKKEIEIKMKDNQADTIIAYVDKYITNDSKNKLRKTIDALLPLLDYNEIKNDITVDQYDPDGKIDFNQLNEYWKEKAQESWQAESIFIEILNVEDLSFGIYKKTILLNLLKDRYIKLKDTFKNANDLLDNIKKHLENSIINDSETHDDSILALIIIYGVRECKVLKNPPKENAV